MMKKRVADKFWFPWWPDKWIFGSMRIECTVEERAIWVDLLSLASKDNGHIRANEEIPYPLEQLAGMLRIPEKVFVAAVNKFLNLKDKDGHGKLTEMKDGTLYVTKWEDYQFSESYHRVHKHRKKEDDSRRSNGKSLRRNKKPLPYYNKINNSIVNNNKEEQKISLTKEQEILIDEELKTVKGIGEKKRQMIICYLRELSIEFPDLDYVYQMKKKCAWWLDNPLNKKSNIHLQIRNWFGIAQKGFTEARKEQQVGKDTGKKRTKYPIEFLSKVYAVLRKQGKDNTDYSKRLFDIDYYQASQLAIKYKDNPEGFIKFLEEE